MTEKCICKLYGHPLKDSKARENISVLNELLEQRTMQITQNESDIIGLQSEVEELKNNGSGGSGGTQLYYHSIDMGGGLGITLITTHSNPYYVDEYGDVNELQELYNYKILSGADYSGYKIIATSRKGFTTINNTTIHTILFNDVDYFYFEQFNFVDTVSPI